jgi:hypothetical protein
MPTTACRGRWAQADSPIQVTLGMENNAHCLSFSQSLRRQVLEAFIAVDDADIAVQSTIGFAQQLRYEIYDEQR